MLKIEFSSNQMQLMTILKRMLMSCKNCGNQFMHFKKNLLLLLFFFLNIVKIEKSFKIIIKRKKKFNCILINIGPGFQLKVNVKNF